MDFTDGKSWEKAGKWSGFALMYLIFTAIAFLLFKLLHKIPENFTYFYMIPFTMLIVLLGAVLMQLYKL
jgi:hypothetical protein